MSKNKKLKLQRYYISCTWFRQFSYSGGSKNLLYYMKSYMKPTVLEDEEVPMPPGNNDNNQMDVTPMLDTTNQKSGFDNISKIQSPGIQNPEIEDMDEMIDAGTPLGAMDDMAPPTPAEYLPPPTPGMPMDEMPPTPGFAMPPTPGMPMTPGVPQSPLMPAAQHGNNLVNSQNLLNLDSVQVRFKRKDEVF